MAINFPDSPTIGDEYTANGFVWTWTGAAWEKVGASTAAANDFALLVGATGNTTYVLDRAYTAGRYTLSFANGDTTYDIYFVAEDGTYAGYTSGSFAEVSANFAEVVVLGADTNETILFAYQGTLTSPSSTGDVAVAGAFINSVVTSSLPNIDDTTVVNGGNLAADVAVSFIGQDTTETAAKTVVRSSSTQLVVTRPDSFSPDNSPYTVKVVNPGIPVPAGTNAHLLSNAVTAGTNPSWVTPTDIYYNVGAATSITLLATDTEGSDIDYSLVSGTLPAGLTLDNETGVISGTFSGTANEGDVTNITVRAIDTGGNFLDRAFNLTANTAPTWITPAGALDPAPVVDTAYSYQLEASTGTAGGALTYTLVAGALLTGHTLSSTGLISGTSTDPVDTVASFTVRVTDEGGLFVERAFSATVGSSTVLFYSAINTSQPGNGAAGMYSRNLSINNDGELLAIYENDPTTEPSLDLIGQHVAQDGVPRRIDRWGNGPWGDYDPRAVLRPSSGYAVQAQGANPSTGMLEVFYGYFDASGNRIWETGISHSNSNIYGQDPDAGSNGYSVLPMRTENGNRNAITVFNDSDGSVKWWRQYSTTGNSGISAICGKGSDNRVYSAAYDGNSALVTWHSATDGTGTPYYIGDGNNRVAYLSANTGSALRTKAGAVLPGRMLPMGSGFQAAGLILVGANPGTFDKVYQITRSGQSWTETGRGADEDNEGNLYLFSYGTDNSAGQAYGYLTKINPATNSIVWARRFAVPGLPIFGLGAKVNTFDKTISVPISIDMGPLQGYYQGAIFKYPLDGSFTGSFQASPNYNMVVEATNATIQNLTTSYPVSASSDNWQTNIASATAFSSSNIGRSTEGYIPALTIYG